MFPSNFNIGIIKTTNHSNDGFHAPVAFFSNSKWAEENKRWLWTSRVRENGSFCQHPVSSFWCLTLGRSLDAFFLKCLPVGFWALFHRGLASDEDTLVTHMLHSHTWIDARERKNSSRNIEWKLKSNYSFAIISKTGGVSEQQCAPSLYIFFFWF